MAPRRVPPATVTTVEVEFKLRCEHEVVRDRLEAAGFAPAGRWLQRDTYFDHPARRFADTDEALRLREERRLTGDDTRYALTYKGPRRPGVPKARVERSVPLEGGRRLVAVLARLDFPAVATVEKRRSRFERDGTVAVLDDVTGLGEFVELERVAPDGRTAAAEAALEGALEELGLSLDDTVDRTYLDLLLDNL